MPYPILQIGDKGEEVKRLQAALNNRGPHRGFSTIAEDGELGHETWGLWLDLFKTLGGSGFSGTVAAAQRRYRVVVFPGQRTKLELARAKTWRKRVAKRRAKAGALRERAWKEAGELLGVMEQGGNNRGAKVMEIIRANGGTGPEPWCGDFVAYCYRKAGSKAVDRRWASVYFLGRLPLVRKTNVPRKGDIVRFSFDHTGLFGVRLPESRFRDREGNTGPSGAVSDSSTGGDGVYEKIRSTSLVADYRKVTK